MWLVHVTVAELMTAEALWPAEPKILTPRLFPEKFPEPWVPASIFPFCRGSPEVDGASSAPQGSPRPEFSDLLSPRAIQVAAHQCLSYDRPTVSLILITNLWTVHMSWFCNMPPSINMSSWFSIWHSSTVYFIAEQTIFSSVSALKIFLKRKQKERKNLHKWNICKGLFVRNVQLNQFGLQASLRSSANQKWSAELQMFF